MVKSKYINPSWIEKIGGIKLIYLKQLKVKLKRDITKEMMSLFKI